MSYATTTELTDYATARGITIVGDAIVLLTKALDYVDSQNYKGSKTSYLQPYAFPRIMDVSLDFNPDVNAVPTNIKTAQIVAALLIDSGEDLQANQTQSVKREKVDVIEVEYQDGTTTKTRYTSLDALLRPYLENSLRGRRV